MIISASYKTDIPTFYGEWFQNRLAAEYCMMVTPHNRRAYRISLEPDQVDGFVFWTKNLGPFLDKLTIVSDRGYPFMIEYTVNEYPRSVEFSVVDSERSVQHIRFIAERYGPRAVVWRYDPILVSSVTPIDFHKSSFEKLAAALEGATDEVVISFAQIYRKTQRNMTQAAKDAGVTWEDPPDEVKFALSEDLAKMAATRGMQLTMCSQDQFLAPGVKPARCVDAARLSDIAGHSIPAELRGNRPECGCYASKDIGEYDTCPHGCVHCYAVQNRDPANPPSVTHTRHTFILPFHLLKPSLLAYSRVSDRAGHGEACFHRQNYPGDPAGLFAGQENRGPTHVPGGAFGA